MKTPASLPRRTALWCLLVLTTSGLRAADISPGNLPTAKEVIAKYVKALGGREAILKSNSHHYRGKFEMAAQGLSGDLEVFAAKPNKLLIKIDLPGFGQVMSGFDGKVAWSMDPAAGPSVFEGKMLEQTRDDADFYSELFEEKNYKTMEVLGEEVFDGKKCYKLRLVRKSGRELAAYFDQATGYQAGTVGDQESAMGTMTVTSIVGDFKKFGDVTIPTKLRQKVAAIEQVMTITTVEFDKVAEADFDLPAPVKSLANREKK